MTVGLIALSLAVTQTYTGGRLSVRPVYYLRAGVSPPTKAFRETLTRHLKIAQSRYKELLDNVDTFRIARSSLIFASSTTVEQLSAQPNGAAEFVLKQILAHEHLTRWNCPYVYVIVYLGTGAFPGGGGRPINGGHNLGGGIIILSSELVEKSPNFQSTLQHELGHAFGLVHVDAYGYDMATNPSFMSYNPSHHTKGFLPSSTPGSLMPEDYRGLGLNKNAFPAFVFDPRRHVPEGYEIKEDVQYGPMDLD